MLKTPKLPLDLVDVTVLQNISQGWGSNSLLSQATNRSMSTITELIDKLEDYGLVLREGGGKHTTYRLTELGSSVLKNSLYFLNIAFVEQLRLNSEVYEARGERQHLDHGKS